MKFLSPKHSNYLKCLFVLICMLLSSNGLALHKGHKKHHSNLHKKQKISHTKHKHKKQVHKKKAKNYMVGTASYYGEGDNFDGKTMADGKKFDTNSIYDSAHPTLQLGTKLAVTNLRNGRTIYVEVTDRMPKSSNRVIDLSSAAAKALGMHRQGIARVKLVRISEDEFAEKKQYLEVDSGDHGTPS